MAREILIADGNKAAHKAFEEIFKETDYNLIFSENGEDALLKMKLFKPVLVIADVTMPDKNGKELCQVLKGDPDLNKVPFVLLGGPFDEDIEEEKQQVRADGTITKPLRREPILRLVDGLLMAEPAEGIRETDEEILELQPMAEGIESVSSQEGEEIIDLLDVIEEPVAKPEQVFPETAREAMKGAEVVESGEEAPVGDQAIADLELPEDMGFPKAEEEIQTEDMEGPIPGVEVPEEVDLAMEPAEMEGKVSPEEEMAEPRGIDEQYPGALEETSEPEPGPLGAEEVTEEIPIEGMGELPQDVLKGKGLEEALSEEIEELPEDLLGEKTPEETYKEWEDIEDTGEAELEGLEEVEKETEVLRDEEGALEEALKELSGEALEGGKVEGPAEGPVSIEELGELEEAGKKIDVLKEEEGIPKEESRELPAESLEEGELEKLSGGDISTEEFEWQPQEISKEMDLDGLAEKVLREEDLHPFGEQGQEEGELEGFHEEVFREGELEKLAEEATRDQEEAEIAGGALAEAIEEFTGEMVREGEERGVQPSQERPVQETISGAIKELVEGMSAKVLPKLTEAIAAAAAERIEKTVQKIVPAMAEEAIQKEIRRLEKIKKEEDFDT
ncbi:MAG: PleD family two-component system response regulator [Thermodesulfobacteriota bacterium]